jgi:ACT domain
MPLLYARIVVDDKPGSLAAVTRGLAAAGADIVTVDVLGSEGGLAVDDFVLRVADGPLGAQVIRELAGLPGVAVESVRIARDAPDRRPDLDALARMLRDPGRALQTYVERLPDVMRADWALGLMPVGKGEVVAVARSKNAPRDAVLDVPEDGVSSPRVPSQGDATSTPTGTGGAVMVREPAPSSTVTAYCEIRPGGPVVAVVREGGPSFRAPELAHLHQLCEVAALLSGAPVTA